MGFALVLALFVAPEDADQGVSQRIFYIHVPIALTSYFCFGLGALEGAAAPLARGRALRPRELRGDPPGHDLRRADADHGRDLGEGVVGRVVDLELEPARPLPRPLPLLLRVLHAPLLARGRPSPARSSAVYALFGVVLIPISFLAIRLAEDFIHPTCSRARGRR